MRNKPRFVTASKCAGSISSARLKHAAASVAGASAEGASNDGGRETRDGSVGPWVDRSWLSAGTEARYSNRVVAGSGTRQLAERLCGRNDLVRCCHAGRAGNSYPGPAVRTPKQLRPHTDTQTQTHTDTDTHTASAAHKQHTSPRSRRGPRGRRRGWSGRVPGQGPGRALRPAYAAPRRAARAGAAPCRGCCAPRGAPAVRPAPARTSRRPGYGEGEG